MHHLQQLRELQSMPGGRFWSQGAGVFRRRFEELLQTAGLGGLGFKPYSLRRGGATSAFRSGQPLEEVLMRGRWRHVRVARPYIVDGLATMSATQIPESTRASLSFYASLVKA